MDISKQRFDVENNHAKKLDFSNKIKFVVFFFLSYR
jgi:hypothetical protein